jgi:hypothetical protein
VILGVQLYPSLLSLLVSQWFLLDLLGHDHPSILQYLPHPSLLSLLVDQRFQWLLLHLMGSPFDPAAPFIPVPAKTMQTFLIVNNVLELSPGDACSVCFIWL